MRINTQCFIWSLSFIPDGNRETTMLTVLPASEQELNNLLEVQLSSLVLDWSKRVDEKQTTINELEQKVLASNRQIEKLSKYITHWRRVERQTTTNPPNHYNTTPPTSTRSVRVKQQKRRRQQSPQPLQPQQSVKRCRHSDNSFRNQFTEYSAVWLLTRQLPLSRVDLTPVRPIEEVWPPIADRHWTLPPVPIRLCTSPTRSWTWLKEGTVSQ